MKEWNVEEMFAVGEHVPDLESLKRQVKRMGFKILIADEGEPYMLIDGTYSNIVILPEDPEPLQKAALAALHEERKSRGIQTE